MTWDIKSAPKLDFDEDYYSVLEVDPKIAAKDLKKAYYSIVFIYHPDRKLDLADKDLANKQMMVINGKSASPNYYSDVPIRLSRSVWQPHYVSIELFIS